MQFKTTMEIREANKEKGDHFFEEGTMRFFDSVVYGPVYSGRYFVTSEKGPNRIRAYSVRQVNEDGSIDTVFQAYKTLDQARRAAKRLRPSSIPGRTHYRGYQENTRP